MKNHYVNDINILKVIHNLDCFNIPSFPNFDNHFINPSIIHFDLIILLNHYLNRVMAINLLIIPLVQPIIQLTTLVIILINIPILIIILIRIIIPILIIIHQLIINLIDTNY